jgi:hypothetical protein
MARANVVVITGLGSITYVPLGSFKVVIKFPIITFIKFPIIRKCVINEIA